MKNPKIDVDYNLCKACLICIDICPKDVLDFSMDKSNQNKIEIITKRYEACTNCMMCEMTCPDMAITVIRDIKEKVEYNRDKGI